MCHIFTALTILGNIGLTPGWAQHRNHARIWTRVYLTMYLFVWDGPFFSNATIIKPLIETGMWHLYERWADPIRIDLTSCLVGPGCSELEISFMNWRHPGQPGKMSQLPYNFGFSTAKYSWRLFYEKGAGWCVWEDFAPYETDWKSSHLSEIAQHTGLIHPQGLTRSVAFSL